MNLSLKLSRLPLLLVGQPVAQSLPAFLAKELYELYSMHSLVDFISLFTHYMHTYLAQYLLQPERKFNHYTSSLFQVTQYCYILCLSPQCSQL